MTVVYLLDSAPDWDRLVAAHDWASRLVPRFRQRVVEPPLGLGAPTWVVDAEFDLGYHVRRVRLPEPGTLRQLLDLAQATRWRPSTARGRRGAPCSSKGSRTGGRRTCSSCTTH